VSLYAGFVRALEDGLDGAQPLRVGVAVSGGGDSTALLLLARRWADERGGLIRAATVDHGLRPEAAGEAAQVAARCARLGLEHRVLNWRGWRGVGNLQAEARKARYRLLADWARQNRLQAVALGHTRDDQAETVLMRLARGSGVDGLSGIAPRRRADGVLWLRPLLEVSRDRLRAFLKAQGVDWLEDPSNADRRFARVNTRRALDSLAPLGIGRAQLADTAARLRAAREVLEQATHAAARDLARVRAGGVLAGRDAFLALPAEIRRRFLAHCLKWVSTAAYAPRHAALLRAEADIAARRKATLHGCLIAPEGDDFVIAREYAAVAGCEVAAGEIWDGRWRILGPAGAAESGLRTRALGENGLKSVPEWRNTGFSRALLLSSPALWRGGDLVAAPLAGAAGIWRAEMTRGENDFLSSVLSH